MFGQGTSSKEDISCKEAYYRREDKDVRQKVKVGDA